jgi:hypothetical protein
LLAESTVQQAIEISRLKIEECVVQSTVFILDGFIRLLNLLKNGRVPVRRIASDFLQVSMFNFCIGCLLGNIKYLKR